MPRPSKLEQLEQVAEQSQRSAEREYEPEPKEPPYTIQDLIPMGSTLLNLAMSGKKEGGARVGRMINIIGASHGGKTMVALSALAEACYNPNFRDYQKIYDDAEEANDFDMEYMFGSKAYANIKAPRYDDDGVPDNSDTVEKFHSNIRNKIKAGTPFIYVQDSIDALDTVDDQKKTEDKLEAMEKGKDVSGSYGMAKAKGMKSILRDITSQLKKTKSALFLISQIIDNVDPMSFKKQTRAGGHALKFFATHEMWLRPKGKITKGTDKTVIGTRVVVEITKNKLTGKARDVEFDIYYDYGIDDIGSCIDYLIEQKRWSGGGNSKIDFGEDFPFDNCTKPKLVSLIEEDDSHYEHLKCLVEEEWNKFEDSLKLGRKRKYE